jgi:hypothetical protein
MKHVMVKLGVRQASSMILAFLLCGTTEKGKRKDTSRTAGKLQGHASAMV